ncbi:CKLF-like MARVEL transmembrane domain-containing protein 4 [Saccoglossus kowalevskii]|uniref:MARVEL domain-containing protein 1-like n=1 Tax=Saccoglossus kowalevskii TaxID=10224 RepID=A0ABM0GYS2_SACKO|nr:PREDICTED: MARVEL domain-containing protein 1-like [Saccoglossus kowalevskii]
MADKYDPEGVPPPAASQQTTVTTTTTTTSTGLVRDYGFITCDWGYPIKTMHGIMKLVQIILSLLCLICISASPWYWGKNWSSYRFLQFVTCFCLSCTGTLILNYMTKCLYRVPLPWLFIELCYTTIAFIFYLIGSSCVAAATYGNGGLGAAAAFGFFAMVAYGVEGYFLFREWRTGRTHAVERGGGGGGGGGVTTTTVAETKQEAPPAYSP